MVDRRAWRTLPLIAALSAASGCGGNVVVDAEPGSGGGTGSSSSAGGAGPGTSTGSGQTSSGTGTGTMSEKWESYSFPSVEANTPCGGERYVMYNAAYSKWVGAVLCSPERYKLFMAENKEGPYYEITDCSYHGQDHCELVNPDFTMTDDGDIKSGGCETCEISSDIIDVPITHQGFARCSFGEPFYFEPSIGSWGLLTATWIQCGVTIP
ncbi:MAG TPA: hypothetical protein VLS89_13770 [Candidatus Nanopelagicales bacterium]|nr:hypothetical protein [Candidatus Nanopelagicales bacterium]